MVVRYSRGSGDFYHKYRPCTFDEVVGNRDAISSIKKIVTSSPEDRPRALLFYGKSGCGKTTTARIFSMSINCENLIDGNPCQECPSCKSVRDIRNDMGVQEINAADARGIDDIRQIRESILNRSMFTSNKVFILDEAHHLTNEAQTSLLKVLEDAPLGVYIILCSTEPKKLLNTVVNRCHKFEFSSPTDDELRVFLKEVCLVEESGVGVLEESISKIVDYSDGCPRSALVNLQKVISAGVSGNPAAIGGVLGDIDEENPEAIELARMLCSGTVKWHDLITTYKSVKTRPETVRLTIAGYFRVLLERVSSRALGDKYASILDMFSTPMYDSKPENKLVLALYRSHTIMSRG